MSDHAALLRGRTIGVLCGGPSSEREVSLESGRNVAQALTSAGHAVRYIDVNSSFDAAVARGLDVDVAFLALHGAFGEDGQIQAILEAVELPYTGSGVAASALAFDKIQSKHAFRDCAVPTPAWLCFDMSKTASRPNRVALPLPFVVKPAAAGSSIGVTIVRAESEIAGAIAKAAESGPHVLVESYVAGRELTVGVLGDSALPPAELRLAGEFYDYHAKYADDRTQIVCPAELTPEVTRLIQATGLAAHRALGCRDVSRTDIILDAAGSPWVREVNTLPGMTSHSLLPRAAAASGKSFAALCEEVLCLALSRAPRKSERTA